MKTLLSLFLSLFAVVFVGAAETRTHGEFKVTQILPDGVLVDGNYQVGGSTKYFHSRNLLITGVKDKAVGESFHAEIEAAGPYSYTDAAGVNHTTRKFTLIQYIIGRPEPGAPVQPLPPKAPEAPVPAKPAVPATPGAPTPATPATPGTPSPSAPGTPAAPTAPAVPGTPAATPAK